MDPTQLTNAQLVSVLDPTSSEYGAYLPFVYEDSGWSWCDGFDVWFGTDDSEEEEEGGGDVVRFPTE